MGSDGAGGLIMRSRVKREFASNMSSDIPVFSDFASDLLEPILTYIVSVIREVLSCLYFRVLTAGN
jgi:hypothetical protein